MMENKYWNLRVKQSKLIALKRKHPWVFSGALMLEQAIPDGSVVRLIDRNDNYYATGYYQDASIAVRILDYTDSLIDQEFWNNKINDAITLRKEIGLINNNHTNCFRLINGEGDGIPGVIIDYYNGSCVIEIHAEAFESFLENVKTALKNLQLLNISNIIVRRKYRPKSIDTAEVSKVSENGLQFRIDVTGGQKTGFFLDQRRNRAMVGEYAKDKNVLNLFSYTGGFSLYALREKAKSVVSVDVSKYAITELEENIKLNKFEDKKHIALAMDVKEYLKEMEEDHFDLVIVDPPAFAKSIKKRHNAVQAYKRLNAQVMSLIKSKGIIFTFSCSQVVDTALFENTIRAAAIEVDRKIQILHYLSQAPDHPNNIYHPEGRYLKGLVLYVN